MHAAHPVDDLRHVPASAMASVAGTTPRGATYSPDGRGGARGA